MAQAARLNLRMQKELQLLTTDPPPGVSIPQLLDSEHPLSSSLSSIEPRIEGPEGTVYSKGVFTIKIQIPERYPFQPPNVTFITPIYHPNIDDGGRICLDILNLPPKGAWQPSLNISTVLTSIGLLLSEPNPDDGLMAETSKEYKYNRQAFDQKARSWTEKYANAQNTGRSNPGSYSDAQPTMELGMKANIIPDAASRNVNNEIVGSRKKLRLTGERLSLKPKTTEETRNDEENVPPSRKLSISHFPKPLVMNSSSSIISEHGKACFEQKPPRDDGEGLDGECKQVDEKPKDVQSIIVSDSEDSDEERPLRSRWSLMRKQYSGKIAQINDK